MKADRVAAAGLAREGQEPRPVANRGVLEGISFVLHSGIGSKLPEEFGSVLDGLLALVAALD
ncbi:hypothetical protein ACPCHT_17810 [Nucisporomicrobium flavum]|uniref:hypothetical protein n=1 Tax=Nucisporomicrobium flavum TaxID=2785915 RepID=UPI003C2CE1BB